MTYLAVGGSALIIFLFWRWTAVASQRDDALGELHKLRTICRNFVEGHGLQQDALHDLREALDSATPHEPIGE